MRHEESGTRIATWRESVIETETETEIDIERESAAGTEIETGIGIGKGKEKGATEMGTGIDTGATTRAAGGGMSTMIKYIEIEPETRLWKEKMDIREIKTAGKLFAESSPSLWTGIG